MPAAPIGQTEGMTDMLVVASAEHHPGLSDAERVPLNEHAERANLKFLNTFQSVLYLGVGTGRPVPAYLTFGAPLQNPESLPLPFQSTIHARRHAGALLYQFRDIE